MAVCSDHTSTMRQGLAYGCIFSNIYHAPRATLCLSEVGRPNQTLDARFEPRGDGLCVLLAHTHTLHVPP